MTALKNTLLGQNGTKGVLLRSGIITAVVTTIFVVIQGWAQGDIPGQLMAQKDTLMPMWTAAITILLGSPSKKIGP
jgi:hypothetical protein